MVFNAGVLCHRPPFAVGQQSWSNAQNAEKAAEKASETKWETKPETKTETKPATSAAPQAREQKRVNISRLRFRFSPTRKAGASTQSPGIPRAFLYPLANSEILFEHPHEPTPNFAYLARWAGGAPHHLCRCRAPWLLLNARIHTDTDEPDTRIADWTSDLLSGSHPTFAPNDCLVVEDPSTADCLDGEFNFQDLDLCRDSLQSRPPKLVDLNSPTATATWYASVEIIHEWSRERGELVGPIARPASPTTTASLATKWQSTWAAGGWAAARASAVEER